MTLTKEQRDRIAAVAEEYDFDYACIAVRKQEEPFALGEIDHVSHIWDNGEDTGEELNGLCGIKVNALDDSARYNGYYFGRHIAVIAGNSYEYGEDAGEVIISDPVVISIIA